jgi:tetratricopeptide (TPR) repeat protein
VSSLSSAPGGQSLSSLAETRYYDAIDSLARGDVSGAIAGFRSSLAADPGYADSAHGLLHALKDDGQFDVAIAVAQQLIAANPDDALAHTSLSILYQHQGKIPEAEAAATRAKLAGWKQQLREQNPAEGGA